jgi:hypothetical protein
MRAYVASRPGLSLEYRAKGDVGALSVSASGHPPAVLAYAPWQLPDLAPVLPHLPPLSPGDMAAIKLFVTRVYEREQTR